MYAHENGCPWDKAEICEHAANHGQLDCLVYLHKNGCSWTQRTSEHVSKYVANYGATSHVMEYLHETNLLNTTN
jgi:hypothetical protein